MKKKKSLASSRYRGLILVSFSLLQILSTLWRTTSRPTNTLQRKIPSSTSRPKPSGAHCQMTGLRRSTRTSASVQSCAPTNSARWSSDTGECSPRLSASSTMWVGLSAAHEKVSYFRISKVSVNILIMSIIRTRYKKSISNLYLILCRRFVWKKFQK